MSGQPEKWVKFEWRMGAEEIAKIGPTVVIEVRRISDGAWIKAKAQIDTGATVTALSPDFAKHLGVPVAKDRVAHFATQEAVTVPVVSASLRLEKGPQIDLDCIVTQFGEPHKVLIGRDLLRLCRIMVNFKKGHVTLHLGLHLMEFR